MFLRQCLAAFAAAWAAAAAGHTTVCTITVNSSDEREAFRRHLPAGDYSFVELVEHGRPDWLGAACRKNIECDVLVVSGHFAGTEFYSSRPEVNETLRADEIERVQCSGSCNVFAHLKEVYLFGCDSLKAEPVKSATPQLVEDLVRGGESEAGARRIAYDMSRRYDESSRDLMRRLFHGVPVIYGFASLAPYGRTAGPLLERYFATAPAGEIGSGVPSAKLLTLFGPSSMTVASGFDATEMEARATACRYADDRNSNAQRIGLMHAALAAPPADVRMSFNRVETYFTNLDAGEREEPGNLAALASLAQDDPARAQFLNLTRVTSDPALRLRMVALARNVGWLDATGERAEIAAAIGDMMASRGMGFSEVELVCGLNDDRSLDGELARFDMARLPRGTAQDAARACLGSRAARAEVLRALASGDEREAQIAEAYLRHRPIADREELRTVALDVARMPRSAGQVRALEAIARQHVSDRATFAALADLFAHSNSPAVQRAIAEVFLRADRAAVTPEMRELVTRHRIRPAGQDDVIDNLVASLPR